VAGILIQKNATNGKLYKHSKNDSKLFLKTMIFKSVCPDGFGGLYCEQVAKSTGKEEVSNCVQIKISQIIINIFPQGQCGGLITEKAGLINTPNYPSYYPDFIQCFWLIQVEKHNVIYSFLLDDSFSTVQCF